jgi:hypothetical protein
MFTSYRVYAWETAHLVTPSLDILTGRKTLISVVWIRKIKHRPSNRENIRAKNTNNRPARSSNKATVEIYCRKMICRRELQRRFDAVVCVPSFAPA